MIRAVARAECLVQTERFICYDGSNSTDVLIYGWERVEQTWRMSQMNLADNGGVWLEGSLFINDQHACTTVSQRRDCGFPVVPHDGQKPMERMEWIDPGRCCLSTHAGSAIW